VTELSPKTLSHIDRLFDPADRPEAERVLVTRCGAQLPGMSKASAIDLERIRFAALRLSKGRLADLAEAVSLAETDWRDLLVSAEFAEDPTAHLGWTPSKSER